MPEEKRPRGRPRKYPTNAARKKAYRDRKKAERVELEKRVAELEKKFLEDDTSNNDIISRFRDFTFKDFREMDTSELEEYNQLLTKEIFQDMSLYSPLHVLIDDLMDDYNNQEFLTKEKRDETIIQKTKNKISDSTKTIQLLTLHHIIETEIGKRKEQDILDMELNVLEQKIIALEQEIVKKKESKLIATTKRTIDD